jgi:hypothetical protein
MVEHAYNSSTWRQRQEDLEFKANLGYITSPCLKKENKTKN